MSRDFFGNKWVLGGIVFLIVFSVACVFWYRYDTAPYRKSAAKTDEIIRKWEAKKATTDDKIQHAPDAPFESKISNDEDIPTGTSTAEPITDNKERLLSQAANTIQTALGTLDLTIDTSIQPYMEESPFGFGSYPTIPNGCPAFSIWMTTKDVYYGIYTYEERKNLELLARVTVKLWNEGHTNITGSTIDSITSKVYVNIPNTVYITVKDEVLPDGTITQRITRKYGKAPNDVDLLNPPSYIKVMDYDTSGIDPYEYLNLK